MKRLSQKETALGIQEAASCRHNLFLRIAFQRKLYLTGGT